jgi:hypothetical protein
MRRFFAVLLGTLLLFWTVTPAFADNIAYSNGPLNGQHASWSISGSFVVSNSFTLTANYGVINRITGFEFWAWTVHGDHPNAITWSLTSRPNGGIVYGSGTANLRQLYTFVYTNQLGFDVYRIVTPPAPTINLAPGNYWLNLTNATTTQGNSLYWDENDGVNCGSRGCPSTAYQNGVSIGSEAFIIFTLCPHCIP